MQADAAEGEALPRDDDATDMLAARDGDQRAFERLFRRYSAVVYRYAWLVTGSRSLADDVMQETFIRLLDRSGFDPARGSLPAYLCGIARHVAIKCSDARLSYVEDPATIAEAPAADLPELPSDSFERRRALDRLYAAIRQLPPVFRDVLILVELQQMSYADAAAIVGIEIGTVRSRLSRAKARLSLLLQQGAR